MSEKQKFREIVSNIRADLEYIHALESNLQDVITEIASFENTQLATDTRQWIVDVFLDKFFETDAKIRKLLGILGLKEYELIATESEKVKQNLERVALTLDILMLPRRNKDEIKAAEAAYKTFSNWLNEASYSLNMYTHGFEKIVIDATSFLYQTDWLKMKDIIYEDFIATTKRRKYVTAREEIEKAKQAAKNGQWEEILNHLRPAIDLAIKEKFGFKRINPMKQFLIEAEKFNLGLPTYTMLYDYFDEGSQRIHSGKLNTPYECQNALEFVAGFIDRLDLVQVDQQKIDEFKQSCRCVE